jgi:endonuclease III
MRPYKGLTGAFMVEPNVLADAKEADLKETIRSGGLCNVKAKESSKCQRLS